MSLQFSSECVITGAKSFNQTVDGIAHDFTKISVMVDFAEGVGVGGETVQYKWGKSENYKKIQDLPFPLKAKIDFELATTGSRQTTIVKNVTPLTSAPAK